MRVVVRDARVDEHQRAEGLAVVRRGRGDELVRAGNRPRTSSSMSGRSWRGAKLPCTARGVAAVERRDPGQVGRAAVAVDVVPARVDDPAVVGHAGVPLVGLVEAEAADVAAVGGHVVQRVGRADAAAAQVAAAALGDEGDPPVGQPAGIEVVPGAVGQLLQAASRRR